MWAIQHKTQYHFHFIIIRSSRIIIFSVGFRFFFHLTNWQSTKSQSAIPSNDRVSIIIIDGNGIGIGTWDECMWNCSWRWTMDTLGSTEILILNNFGWWIWVGHWKWEPKMESMYQLLIILIVEDTQLLVLKYYYNRTLTDDLVLIHVKGSRRKFWILNHYILVTDIFVLSVCYLNLFDERRYLKRWGAIQIIL